MASAFAGRRNPSALRTGFDALGFGEGPVVQRRASNQAVPAVRLCESFTGRDELARVSGTDGKVGLAALVAKAYPGAKAALIAQGRPAAQVEAMPAVQVTALYTYQLSSSLRDDVFKWTGIPRYEAYRNVHEPVVDGRIKGRRILLLHIVHHVGARRRPEFKRLSCGGIGSSTPSTHRGDSHATAAPRKACPRLARHHRGTGADSTWPPGNRSAIALRRLSPRCHDLPPVRQFHSIESVTS